jgi:hypothetical protein
MDKKSELIDGRTMNPYEFYKFKTNHDLKEDCGVRMTGSELFTLMNQYAAHSKGIALESSVEQTKESKTAEEDKFTNLFKKFDKWIEGIIDINDNVKSYTGSLVKDISVKFAAAILIDEIAQSQPEEPIKELERKYKLIVKNLWDAANKEEPITADYLLKQLHDLEIIDRNESKPEKPKELSDEKIKKQLLKRFGFTEDGVDAENQVKIFSFMDWYRDRLNK